MSYFSKLFYKNTSSPFDVLYKFLAITLLIIISSIAKQAACAGEHHIAVIMPMEHESLKQIVQGLQEALSDSNCQITVKNAQGDLNLMHSIMQQLNDQDVDLIVPIGTQAAQVAISIIKNKPIIATAALIDNKNYSLVTAINDEVPITNFLKNLPKLKNIGVIYSNSEKIAPEIEELKKYAKQNNLVLHLRMANSLLELPALVKTTAAEVDSFLLLKDHLIVSGINIINQEAAKRKIPVIACDEGSVVAGASLAIGVAEKQIGALAGEAAKDILNGKSPAAISYQTVKKPTLFINEQNFQKQKILDLKDLELLHLPMQKVQSAD